jgi:hypothetical protein
MRPGNEAVSVSHVRINHLAGFTGKRKGIVVVDRPELLVLRRVLKQTDQGE